MKEPVINSGQGEGGGAANDVPVAPMPPELFGGLEAASPGGQYPFRRYPRTRDSFRDDPRTPAPDARYPAAQRPSRKYQESGMWLELAKFGSLLASLLCLYAVFHVAFLIPGGHWTDRLSNALQMLALAGCVCWGSGWIFQRWDRLVGVKDSNIATSLPMKVFWWAALGIFVLFAISSYFEYYYMPLRRSLSW